MKPVPATAQQDQNFGVKQNNDGSPTNDTDPRRTAMPAAKDPGPMAAGRFDAEPHDGGP
jgi:hypothetical protein